MLILTEQMMREIIVDHYTYPRNKRNPDSDKYVKIRMHSENCIDDLDIYVLKENGMIKDACFNGVGCAISTASTDILCDLVKNQNIATAMSILKNYEAMIHAKPYDKEILDEAIVFMNTSKQAARIRCAMIGCTAIEELIKK
ncbi:MAG: SUF system NifU family Fe-S cluster assembly protein [Bacilli bacterium]